MNEPLYVDEDNLSVAWARVFLEAIQRSGKEMSPVIATVRYRSDSSYFEVEAIRRALDKTLKVNNKGTCGTVANTIFPVSLWNPRRSRQLLYRRYFDILPRIRKCRPNHYGVYFERLVNYSPEKKSSQRINQLERIIENYNSGNHKRSMLQVTTYNPFIDLTNQRQRGFPCLQQIAFIPQGKTGLIVSGYYPTQYLFERAYGNLLGLHNLGRFVAHELRRNLTQLTCMVNVAMLKMPKYKLKSLERKVRAVLRRRD